MNKLDEILDKIAYWSLNALVAIGTISLVSLVIGFAWSAF